MNVIITPQAVSVGISAPAMQTGFGNPVAREYVERDPYEGDYTVIPAATAKVLETNGLRMTDNITVAAIPNNYGLITWNGSTLTVS